MPRQRAAARRIASLDVAPIDEDEQEELIELLRLENMATNRRFINAFSLLFLIPIPLYVHIKYCRRSPVDAFLSIAVQVLAIINVRYLTFIDLTGLPHAQYYSWIKRPFVFSLVMNLLGVFVAYRRFASVPEAANWLFLVPLVSSISSTLVAYWVFGMTGDIENLEKMKYKYKSA